MRILIIGGGIGGFAAAIALRRVGTDAQVYEAAPALREIGAGLGLAFNALWTLDALGLGEEVRSNSRTRVQGGLTRWDGRILTSTSDGLGEVAVMHRAELLHCWCAIWTSKGYMWDGDASASNRTVWESPCVFKPAQRRREMH